jgi:hypothetical protein
MNARFTSFRSFRFFCLLLFRDSTLEGIKNHGKSSVAVAFFHSFFCRFMLLLCLRINLTTWWMRKANRSGLELNQKVFLFRLSLCEIDTCNQKLLITAVSSSLAFYRRFVGGFMIAESWEGGGSNRITLEKVRACSSNDGWGREGSGERLEGGCQKAFSNRVAITDGSAIVCG